MYAVIKTGGKQYKVAQGQTLKVEKLNAEKGATVDFDEVTLLADGADVKIGKPLVEGAKVMAEVVDHGRHRKINVIKFKRRKHHMKRQGHRQYYTEVKVTDIQS